MVLHRTSTIAVLLLTLSGTSLTHAATIRVEKWGDDNVNCGSKAEPCASIQHAVNERSHANDRILVGPGYYEGSVVIDQNSSGENLTGLKLESTAGMHATIIRTTVANTHGIAIYQPRVRIGRKNKGFTVGGADSAGFGAIFSTNISPERIRVEGNRAILSYWGIYIGGSKAQARNNIAEFNSAIGIGCENCDGGLLRDNLSRDNGGDGFEIAHSENLAFMRNVSAYNNGAGAFFDLTSDNARLRNNVSEFNDDNGFTLLDANGSNSQGNIALLNHAYGFDFDQVDAAKAPVINHNLAVFNDDEGFFLDDLIGANVSNNTAVSNAGGFVLTPTSNVQTFRRNNSYASTTGCGIENNSGSPLRPDGHYYGDSSGMDPVINLDDHDATCGADLVGDDFRPGPNSTRTRTAQKL